MQKYQYKTTSKLFYGEWPYKICTRFKDSFKTINFRHAVIAKKNYKDNPQLKNEIDDFNYKIQYLLNQEVKFRIEHKSVNIFLKDEKLFKDTIQSLTKYVTEVWQPLSTNEKVYMIDNKKVRVVDKLPHNIYNYKVTLKQMTSDKRESLALWLKNYPKDIYKVSKVTTEYLNNTRKYAPQQPFILVKESKMLTMFLLQCNECVSKIEQFVTRNSINNQT